MVPGTRHLISEIVQQALQGEDVVIARDNRPIVRPIRLAAERAPRQPDPARGQILFVSPGLDDLPADFGEHV